MKVWQGIGTTILALLLAVFLTVSAVYFVLDRSVLDADQTKKSLATAKVYDQIRNDRFIPQLLEDISSQATYGSALTKTDVLDSLRDAFPQATVTTASNTVIDATYQWLNKKSPDISFSISITDEKQKFLDSLSTRVMTNLKKLPDCRSFSDISDSPSEITCIPPFASIETVHTAIMLQVTEQVQQTDDAITPETLGISTAQLGGYRNTPDYLSYLWTLNLITLPLAGLIALYLIIKRRAVGLLVVGIVLLALSVGCIVAGLQLTATAPPTDAIARQVFVIEQALAGDQLRFLALIGGISGALMITGGILWRKQTKKRQQKHFVSEREA